MCAHAPVNGGPGAKIYWKDSNYRKEHRKYQKDQRIYSWTILCTRDQTKSLTRAFTAVIKAQASLRLPHIGLRSKPLINS